jgi:hypothetical protein
MSLQSQSVVESLLFLPAEQEPCQQKNTTSAMGSPLGIILGILFIIVAHQQANQIHLLAAK